MFNMRSTTRLQAFALKALWTALVLLSYAVVGTEDVTEAVPRWPLVLSTGLLRGGAYSVSQTAAGFALAGPVQRSLLDDKADERLNFSKEDHTDLYTARSSRDIAWDAVRASRKAEGSSSKRSQRHKKVVVQKDDPYAAENTDGLKSKDMQTLLNKYAKKKLADEAKAQEVQADSDLHLEDMQLTTEDATVVDSRIQSEFGAFSSASPEDSSEQSGDLGVTSVAENKVFMSKLQSLVHETARTDEELQEQEQEQHTRMQKLKSTFENTRFAKAMQVHFDNQTRVGSGARAEQGGARPGGGAGAGAEAEDADEEPQFLQKAREARAAKLARETARAHRRAPTTAVNPGTSMRLGMERLAQEAAGPRAGAHAGGRGQQGERQASALEEIRGYAQVDALYTDQMKQFKGRFKQSEQMEHFEGDLEKLEKLKGSDREQIQSVLESQRAGRGVVKPVPLNLEKSLDSLAGQFMESMGAVHEADPESEDSAEVVSAVEKLALLVRQAKDSEEERISQDSRLQAMEIDKWGWDGDTPQEEGEEVSVRQQAGGPAHNKRVRGGSHPAGKPKPVKSSWKTQLKSLVAQAGGDLESTAEELQRPRTVTDGQNMEDMYRTDRR